MDTLFEINPQFPAGFDYVENFISEAEEGELLNIIRKQKLHEFIFRGYEAKRKVASFGFDYNFNNRSINSGVPIPASFNFIIERVAAHLNLPASEFAELLITEYPVGSVINWHRDAPPFDLIAGISLSSDCKFKLRPYDKSKQTRASLLSFKVSRRSMYIMQGESRDKWEHSIDKVTTVRYSVTLRTLRK